MKCNQELIPIYHRHLAKECKDHTFCKMDHIPEHVDKYRYLPLLAHEFNEVKRIILNDEDIDGYMKIKYLRERNSGWFNGLDEQISEGMKLVVDDITIDEWLAAHYELTLD